MGLATKTPDQVRAMRRAGLVVAEALSQVKAAAVAGTTPRDLDALAAAVIADAGATPSFLGYHGYPATLCTSVNEVVVHGIPDDRPLRDGDVISVDCGAVVEGWHGDAAVSIGVGPLAVDVAAMVQACERALAAGIATMRPGSRLADILADSGTALDAVVELVVDSEVVIDRLLKRAEIEGRADDNADTIRRRMEVYLAETAPLTDAYSERGLLRQVDGMGTVDEVTGRIFAALDD